VRAVEESEFYEPEPAPVAGPLAGVRVVEATTTLAGPMCGCVLADLGADVVKIELPGGEVVRRMPLPGTDPPLSFAHAHVNRNKRAMCLDLRTGEGREVFLDLVRRSDAVVQNFRPGTFDKWGIGYSHCRAVNPSIVYVSISGYGQFGPDHDRVGYDPIAEAASGFMSLNGSPNGQPTRCATYLCDDLAGLHGALSAIAALRYRDLTGEGQHIDVALLDSVLFQSNGMLTLGAIGHPLERLGNSSMLSAPVDVFDCRDGQVYVGVLLDSHWRVLTRIIGQPELADSPEYATATARLKNREQCNRLMSKWLQEKSVAEALAEFKLSSIPAAPVRTYAEAARDSHVRERDMLQEIAQEDGAAAPITGPAAKFSRTPTRVRTRAAALGEHNDEILEELGVDAAARRRLRELKVI